ncbi:MAG: KH domain-containing protein [Syntrophales bacterium]|jgi:predicted RNA-binding protein YlqC (UPF0109 family)|nr:KH domain-containing protein [Syntrophales bacterium]MDY0045539.1 KH domain-containing protein [Syntrophales bacterium]
MKDLIKYIVRALVDNPDDVAVIEIKGKTTTVYELHVAKGDLGQVIGRNGATAEALRTLVSAVSSKHKKRVVLDIIE